MKSSSIVIVFLAVTALVLRGIVLYRQTHVNAADPTSGNSMLLAHLSDFCVLGMGITAIITRIVEGGTW